MFQKILVPLDGTEWAERALPYADSMAINYSAELLLVRSLQPMMIVSEYDQTVFYGPQLQQEKDTAEVYLRSIRQKLQTAASTAVLEGQPVAEGIISIAVREEVDLIVMVAPERSRLSRWIAGSVADTILQQAPLPVLLVRVPKP